jgi:hypothetical protein
MVEYIPPELEQNTKDQIEAITLRSLANSPDSMARDAMAKTSDSSGLLGNDQATRIQSSTQAPGGDESVLRAINERNQRHYDSGLRDLGVQQKAEAQQAHGARQARAADLVQKENVYNEQIRQMKLKAAADRRAARAQVLGSIMGIAGAAVGAVAGGGYGGAAVGYAVGSGVGQMAADQGG